MTGPRDYIEFYLNGELQRLERVSAGDTLLEFLREKRGLTGTKEGCAEGDCGACTLLLGRLENGNEGGELRYRAMNSCICFLAMCEGADIIAIEALSAEGANDFANLHWIQKALAEFHGTQCGFCTPGIIMSLYAMWLENPAPDRAAIETALQGNLCRCTGYMSIIRGVLARAVEQNHADDPLVLDRGAARARLEALKGGEVRMDEFAIPASLDGLARSLEADPNARIISGASDIGLEATKGLRPIGPAIFTTNIVDFDDIIIGDDKITIGAGASINSCRDALSGLLPELAGFWPLFAGEQIRNLATIGGNIANASPIGDTPPLLMAMDAKLVLRKGDDEREIALEDYFIAYGKQDCAAGEFISRIEIPLPIQGSLRIYKISKRLHEDISSVFGAINIGAREGTIDYARLAFGGMAATPKRASKAEEALLGKPLEEGTIRDAMTALEEDFTPISDLRASSQYRMKVAKNLLLRYWHETRGWR